MALVTGLLSAVPGSLIASNRAARSRPAEALSESTLPRRGIGPVRLVLGLAALAGAVVLTVNVLGAGGQTADKATPFVLLSFLVSVGLLGPLLARVVTELLALPLRLLGTTGEMATLNGRARARRLSSAIVPVALVVAFGITKIGMQTTMTHESREQNAAALTADLVIDAPAGLPTGVAERTAALSGVRAATGLTDTSVFVGKNGSADARPDDTAVSARAFTGTGDGLAHNLDAKVLSGAMAGILPAAAGGPKDGTVAISKRVADRAGVKTGQPVKLWLGDGTVVRPTVVATYERGLGVGEVLLPQATVAGHLTSQLSDRILVKGADRAQVARLDGELKAALAATPGPRSARPPRSPRRRTRPTRRWRGWRRSP
ncbi:hypothetical protein ACFQ2B_17220 [Streptomyces stramineus]